VIPVNKSLDKKPTIFLIPADQVVPWAIFFVGGFYLGHQMLGLTYIQTGLFIAWGCSTWWILTANGYHHFFGRLMNTPNWVRAITYYEVIIDGKENRN
jgi:hypothetical protein